LEPAEAKTASPLTVQADKRPNVSVDQSVTAESSNDETEIVLNESEMTFDTNELKQYECTRKPRRKAKPAKVVNVNDDVKQSPNVVVDECRQLLDDLYTACKTGDCDSLKRRIKEILNNNQISSCVQSSRTEMQCDSSISVEHKVDTSTEACNDGHKSEVSTVINESESSITPPVSQCESSVAPPVSQSKSSVTPPVSQYAASDEMLSRIICSQFGRPSTTLLHVAAQAGYRTIVRVLLEHGADPSVKDGQNQFPYVLASNKETKNEFRRFMASFPDKFDYVKAQIPGPLTADMELEKKAKLTEKKKLQAKAKKEKLKEEKIESSKRAEEEKRRCEYLAMSDREKRALAAEQRLQVQLKSQSSSSIALCRCWQCGTDMTGKVPFEYYDYKFCSPSCLKSHKLNATSRT
jgi:hypothetical protein